MKSRFDILWMLLASCLLSSCDNGTTFEQDPLCPSCVKRGCHGTEPTFQPHFAQLASDQQAQIIAQMEAQPGCFDKNSWALESRELAYAQYGEAFYGIEQPYLEIRAQHALDDILNKSPRRALAIDYLSTHANLWKDTAWGEAAVATLEDHVVDDDIFALVAQVADAECLGKLSAMEPNAARDAALIYHWQSLPEEAQKRALSTWVTAEWSMQTSGSAQLPQYLTLDWQKRQLPEGVPNFISTLHVTSIKIQNSEVKRGAWKARDVFQWQPLVSADAVHGRVNLTPWLNLTDNYRVSAQAELKIWPKDASKDCLENASSCEQNPILVQPVVLDRSYRVFLGLETGAPHRHKIDADNAKTSQAMTIDLCNAEVCLPLWAEGKRTKSRQTPISVFQGKDFYLKVKQGDAVQPVAGRLMARVGVGKAWREVATFFSYAPMAYDIPVRADIALGSLCPELGKCSLELQLRPSLRMARRDPRIKRYWGATLELGTVQLDVLNQTPI